MRYSIIFPLENGVVIELGDTNLSRAIGFAQRVAREDGDWYEVCDNRTGNIVASSESERKG